LISTLSLSSPQAEGAHGTAQARAGPALAAGAGGADPGAVRGERPPGARRGGRRRGLGPGAEAAGGAPARPNLTRRLQARELQVKPLSLLLLLSLAC